MQKPESMGSESIDRKLFGIKGTLPFNLKASAPGPTIASGSALSPPRPAALPPRPITTG